MRVNEMAALSVAIRGVAFVAICVCSQPRIFSQGLLEVPEQERLVANELIVQEAVQSLASSLERGSEKYVSTMTALAASEPEPARKYLVLKQLMDEAIKSGRIDSTLNAIVALSSTFNLPRYRLRIDAISKLVVDKKVTIDRTQCVGLLITAIRDSIENRDLVTARKGYDVALREIPKEAKKEYTPCFSKLRRAIDEHESLTRERDLIRKQLNFDENDPVSNAAMGRFCILIEGDIEGCKMFFARSQNPKLEEISALESAELLQPDKQRRLGDLWWEFSESQPKECRRRPQERAAIWYLKCIDSMQGVDHAILKTRIETAALVDRCQFAKHDLLSPKLKRRIVNGVFDERKRQLTLNPSVSSLCQFALVLPEEYDLEYKFTRSAGRWGLYFTFPARGREYAWHNGGHESPMGGFSGFTEQESKGAAPYLTPVSIPDNSPQTLLIKIRANTFQCFLDGKCVSEVRDPFRPEIGRPNDQSEFFNLKPRLSVGDYWGTLEIISAIVTEYR